MAALSLAQRGGAPLWSTPLEPGIVVWSPGHPQGPALRELARVCKPGGEIRLLDYTLSKNPARRFVMGLTAPYVRWLYGAAFDRDTERHIAAAGLELVERRFVYRDVIKLLVIRPGA